MNHIQLVRSGIALAALTTLTGLASATTAPNLLKNGDFEANSVVLNGALTNSTLVPDWTYSATGVQPYAQVTSAFDTCATGNCFVGLEFHPEAASLSQSFSSTAGQLLKGQFDYSMFSLPTDSVTLTPSTLSASLNGQALDPIAVVVSNPADRAVAPFTHYTAYVTAEDLDTFEIDYSLGQSSHLYLDNFSITAVPEPTNMALMGCGLIAMFALSRRRSA